MHTAKEFNDLIIKEDNNNIVRFSDIGRAEVAPEDLRSLLKKNGEPMVMTVIIPPTGSQPYRDRRRSLQAYRAITKRPAGRCHDRDDV